MDKKDRLSALMNRFSLTVTTASPDCANLMVFQHPQTGKLSRALLSPLDTLAPYSSDHDHEVLVFGDRLEWGGNLPKKQRFDVVVIPFCHVGIITRRVTRSNARSGHYVARIHQQSRQCHRSDTITQYRRSV